MDSRTRTDTVEIQTAHWNAQLDKLVNSYLLYRMHDRSNGLPKEPASSDNILPLRAFTLETFDTYCNYFISFFNLIENSNIYTAQSYVEFNPVDGEVFPNETMIRHGYLGCAPLHPTLAISIRTLEAYRQLHRTSPRFSIEAQCRTLCHMQNVFMVHIHMSYSEKLILI